MLRPSLGHFTSLCDQGAAWDTERKAQIAECSRSAPFPAAQQPSEQSAESPRAAGAGRRPGPGPSAGRVAGRAHTPAASAWVPGSRPCVSRIFLCISGRAVKSCAVSAGRPSRRQPLSWQGSWCLGKKTSLPLLMAYCSTQWVSETFQCFEERKWDFWKARHFDIFLILWKEP